MFIDLLFAGRHFLGSDNLLYHLFYDGVYFTPLLYIVRVGFTLIFALFWTRLENVVGFFGDGFALGCGIIRDVGFLYRF